MKNAVIKKSKFSKLYICKVIIYLCFYLNVAFIGQSNAKIMLDEPEIDQGGGASQPNPANNDPDGQLELEPEINQDTPQTNPANNDLFDEIVDTDIVDTDDIADKEIGINTDTPSGPTDVFTGASPGFNTSAPEAIKYNMGDWGVADQRGAATYTYPIEVPPGRNRMAPSLAIRYSSQSPIRGGIAVGWALDGLPSIRLDRSLGQTDEPIYKAFIRNVSGRLIEVPDNSPYPGKTYRVDFDDSFTRFIYTDQEDFGIGHKGWVALTTDGIKHYFNELDLPTTFNRTRWHITRQVDSFGNTILYYWDFVFSDGNEGSRIIDIALDRIEYTSNEDAGLDAYTMVKFKYAPKLDTCPNSEAPIGASYDNNFGFPSSGSYTGARRLMDIEIYVRDQEVSDWSLRKRISLAYYMGNNNKINDDGTPGISCDHEDGAPLRYLARIDLTTFDIYESETGLPAITFTYGRKKREFKTEPTMVSSPGYGHYGIESSWDKSSGALGDLMDIDGDGIRDRISVVEDDGICTLVWQKGLFGGTFDEETRKWPLPTAEWHNGIGPSFLSEGCTLNGQVVYHLIEWYPGHYNNYKGIVSYHFMDFTGDGRVDLLTNIWARKGYHELLLPLSPFDTNTPKEDGSISDPFPPSAPLIHNHKHITHMLSESQFPNLPGFTTTAKKDEPGFDDFPPSAPLPKDPPIDPVAPKPPVPPTDPIPEIKPPVVIDPGNPIAPVGPKPPVSPPSNPITELKPGEPIGPPGLGGIGSSPGDTFPGIPLPPQPGFGPEMVGDDPLNGSYFIWRVYANTGSGFSSIVVGSEPGYYWSPITIKSPNSTSLIDSRSTPNLPPSGGDIGIDEEKFFPDIIIPRFADMDGDGFLDIIDTGTATTHIGTPMGKWQVFFGSGGTKFTFSEAKEWPVPPIYLYIDIDVVKGGKVYTDDIGVKHIKEDAVVNLRDFNGDGLPDLIVQQADGHLRVYTNYGGGFYETPFDLGLKAPLQEMQTDYTKITSYVSGNYIVSGHRGYRRRIMDIDGDGLPDMLVLPGSEKDVLDTETPEVYFNTGDRFLSKQLLSKDIWEKAKRLFVVENGKWAVHSDYVDVNGDGLPDITQWSDELDRIAITTDEAYETGPRLLKTIKNGRGLVVEFEYSPSTDPQAVNWEQSSNLAYLPNPVWVVTSLKVSDSHGTPPMSLLYNYKDPVFMPVNVHSDVPEQNHFLGFGNVTVTTENLNKGIPGQKSERTFAYDEKGDPSGRAVEEWIYRYDEGYFYPHKYKEINWKQEPLFFGKVFFAHRESMLTHIFDIEGKEKEVLRTSEIWKPIKKTKESATPLEVVDGNSEFAVLYVKESILQGSGLTEGITDRKIDYKYDTRYGQSPYDVDDYRILKMQTVTNAIVGSSFQKTGETLIKYNLNGLPEETTRYINEFTGATTLRTFDPLTGNLITETKPEQGALGGSGRSTNYSYGPHKLLVEETENELGHLIFTTYDVATGTMIERKGPNSKAGGTNWERETWKIDGLGRILEHAVSIDEGSNAYSLRTVSKTVYLDKELPNQVNKEQLVDFDSDIIIKTDSTFDGHGRLLTETTHLMGKPNAITRYEYDGFGNLSSIEVPDPRVDDGTSVKYHYLYDGLGRLRQFIRPDNTEVSLTYNGLDKILEEITKDGSGSTTKEFYDVFDRIVKVEEVNPESGDAITHYEYDDKDNLTKITDADGNLTKLVHDYVGNRIQIKRGTRIWQYQYDLNGNLKAKIEPVPSGGEISDYTTEYEYDNLDRIKVLKPASRGMPIEQRTKLGIGEIHYAYDEGINGIGRLNRVMLAFGNIIYKYNARGLISNEQRTIDLVHLGFFDKTQSVTRHYNALGNPTLTEWNDGQKWLITYDERGLVKTVEWLDVINGSEWKRVADYNRSIAGQPRNRNTTFGQFRGYSYDVLGRVLKDAVFSSGGIISSRSYDYYDAGDLASVNGATDLAFVNGATAGISALANYTYDSQHRLRNASGPNGYSGTFTYSPAGNIKTAEVNWNGSLSARNVIHQYGATDPQAVDKLVNIAGGDIYAQFTYDLSGNMTMRSTPTGIWEFTWDGDNQLRQAEGPNGTEIYYYDHNSQRILAINETNGLKFWFAERETHYDIGGADIRSYLHLSNDSTTLARNEIGGNIELQYADALQNLMLSIDETGNVVASFLYGPFGEILNSTGEENHSRQFNGKENDIATGLRYYGFRYYDPLTLRWNSADPLYRFVPDLGLTEPQKMNLYTFSLNNPVRYFDPDGREPGDRLHNWALGAGSGACFGGSCTNRWIQTVRHQPFMAMSDSTREKVANGYIVVATAPFTAALAVAATEGIAFVVSTVGGPFAFETAGVTGETIVATTTITAKDVAIAGAAATITMMSNSKGRQIKGIPRRNTDQNRMFRHAAKEAGLKRGTEQWRKAHESITKMTKEGEDLDFKGLVNFLKEFIY